MSPALPGLALPRTCPTCDQPAEVLDTFTMASTAGPALHLKIRCGAGHWYTLPADRVEVYRVPLAAARAA
jgi:hypothetical protein